jgi:phage tail-like protein
MSEEAQDNIWPEPSFYFAVKFGAQENTAKFQEVTGLDNKIKPFEYRQGQFSTVKTPGIPKNQHVTLKKGILGKDSDLYTWFNVIKTNTIKRETVTIQLMDEQGNPTMTWNLLNAWPTKILGTDLKEDSDETTIESLELVFEGLTVTT